MSRARCLMLACALLALLPAGSAAAQSMKPPIRGLISMGAYKFVGSGGPPVNTLAPLDAKPGIFSGLVIVATWAQLQPTRGAEIEDGNAIDQALALVRAYNRRNPQKPLAVKLRIWAGFEAPDWAKSLGGPPIDTVHNNKPRTMGRFWSRPYRKAWAALQDQLAARYDNLPLIRDVAITSCMSFTAEPFFLPTTEAEEATVLTPLQQAGFTPAAYRKCLSNAVNDYAAWKRTRLVFPFNPFRATVNKGSGAGTGQGDPHFTMQVMGACRQALGARCVFDNHDLNAPLGGPLRPIYSYMTQLGGPIEFQTLNATPANFPGTIRLGVRTGAQAIELYQDYKGFPLVPNSKLRRWAEMIENGTP